MDNVTTGEPPFMILRPVRQIAPLVVASAHSGRSYPAEFLAAARLGPLALRRSEDSFVEELFAATPSIGAPMIIAHFPRAYCDANREAWELDPLMFEDDLPPWVNTSSPRVAAGLGTVARVVSSGESIYRHKLRFADAERRVKTCWQPFHAGLGFLLRETEEAFGACLLIDCHSMPANSTGGRSPADFVIGDAHGTACSPRVTRLIEGLLTAFGYRVRRNDPYAGGYITRTYGRPAARMHAVQIEIARSLYMDEARLERGPLFHQVADHMRHILATVAREASVLLGP